MHARTLPYPNTFTQSFTFLRYNYSTITHPKTDHKMSFVQWMAWRSLNASLPPIHISRNSNRNNSRNVIKCAYTECAKRRFNYELNDENGVVFWPEGRLLQHWVLEIRRERERGGGRDKDFTVCTLSSLTLYEQL